MKLTRRDTLALGGSAFALASVGAFPAIAATTEEMIAELTGGADIAEGGVDLTAPEIAENGNTVPISVAAEGAKSITLYADGNPVPSVATANFGPLNPSRSFSTRVRLAKSQNVVAVVQMEDGSWKMAKSAVKVTIGGCGG